MTGPGPAAARPFLGKWSFRQGGLAVGIDAAAGLKAVPPPTDGSDRFNAYGDGSAFVLQAGNGGYVVAAGTGYAATAAAGDRLNLFSLEAAGDGSLRIADHGPDGAGPAAYWALAAGAVASVPKQVTPPDTTLFAQTEVTASLAAILAGGFASTAPDLRWVSIPQTDFTAATATLDFTTSLLDHADLSGCRFPDQTAFDGSSARSVLLTGAGLANCLIGSCRFDGASLDGADCSGTTAEKSVFDGATLRRTSFRNSGNLAGAAFRGATLDGADFSGSLNIDDTDFSGASLVDVDFTGALVTGPIRLGGANCTGMTLCNPADGRIEILPGRIRLDATTNFTRARLCRLDLSGYDLTAMLMPHADFTGSRLVSARLSNADMSYARLDGADLGGTALLNGTNLSNASLAGADLTNAQLGGLSRVFSVASTAPGYAAFLAALGANDIDGVRSVFAANGQTLSGTVTVSRSKFDPDSWAVAASAPPLTYSVDNASIGGQTALSAYLPTTPAVLSNAYLVGATLTSTNLIGVNAAGASIYGSAVARTRLNSALMRGMRLSNANLGGVDLHGADLAGVTFDYATLSNADFSGARLTVSGDGATASFVGANLAGARFDGTTLGNVDFTNAALGVNDPAGSGQLAGIWLFRLSETAAGPVIDELAASVPAASGGSGRQVALPLSLLSALAAPGPVAPPLRAAFKAAGIVLADGAVLTFTGQQAYWQIGDGPTGLAVFRAFDTANYVPALGVAAGGDYSTDPAFFLPLSLQSSLRNGPVAPAVAEAFRSAGHPLPGASVVTIRQTPSEWQIVDGAPDYRVWTVWLALSTQGPGLVARPAIDNLIAAFASASVAISREATVANLPGPAGPTRGWTLNNGADDPFNPVTNYIVFTLLPTTGGGIDVYGRNIRILRCTSEGRTEYYNLPAAATALTQAQMSAPGNVCPNGEFAASNIANALPYDQWLHAHVPARPPICVPDPSGKYLCPA